MKFCDRKPVPSKLSGFDKELLTLNDSGKKLAEIQQYLKERGLSVSTGRISSHLTRLRTARGMKDRPISSYWLEYDPRFKNQLEHDAELRRRWRSGKGPRKLRGVNR